MYTQIYVANMRGFRKFCQRGSNFDNAFLVDEDPNTTTSRPTSNAGLVHVAMLFLGDPGKYC